MPTHALGKNSANLVVNVPKDELALLGRLAFEAGAKSVGEYVRGLIATGLEVKNSASAGHLKAIRRHYYGVMNCTLALLSLSALLTGVDMRRPTRTARSSSSAIRNVRSRKETC